LHGTSVIGWPRNTTSLVYSIYFRTRILFQRSCRIRETDEGIVPVQTFPSRRSACSSYEFSCGPFIT